MELSGGKKLTCCGDEPYNECEEKYARNSTWLFHEAFCLYSQADIFNPYEKHHSTVKEPVNWQKASEWKIFCYIIRRTGISQNAKTLSGRRQTILQRKFICAGRSGRVEAGLNQKLPDFPMTLIGVREFYVRNSENQQVFR